jgi:hypothetical protein
MRRVVAVALTRVGTIGSREREEGDRREGDQQQKAAGPSAVCAARRGRASGHERIGWLSGTATRAAAGRVPPARDAGTVHNAAGGGAGAPEFADVSGQELSDGRRRAGEALGMEARMRATWEASTVPPSRPIGRSTERRPPQDRPIGVDDRPIARCLKFSPTRSIDPDDVALVLVILLVWLVLCVGVVGLCMLAKRGDAVIDRPTSRPIGDDGGDLRKAA